MFLKLAIDGNTIASVPLDAAEAGNLEYLFNKKSLLSEACRTEIARQAVLPVYFIEVASKMNNNRLPGSRGRR